MGTYCFLPICRFSVLHSKLHPFYRGTNCKAARCVSYVPYMFQRAQHHIAHWLYPTNGTSGMSIASRKQGKRQEISCRTTLHKQWRDADPRNRCSSGTRRGNTFRRTNAAYVRTDASSHRREKSQGTENAI